MSLLCFFLILALLAGCDTTSNNNGTDEQELPDRLVQVTINTAEGRRPISRYIYGSNQDLSNNDPWTVRRIGGNRLTGYNWENDFSNAGEDYLHSSDVFMLSLFGLSANSATPAQVMTHFHDQSLATGAASIVTLQLAGYVSADQQGTVLVNQTAPSSRWNRVEFKKEAPFESQPDRTDGVVYMDEFVQFMIDTYGSAASDRGIKWYSLDNEPGLWAFTHPRIHPDPVGAKELVDRSIALALAVKAVDPDAKITGPALYGFAAFESLQSAPDWEQEKKGRWFIDYYLDRMRSAELEHGIRLLDVLDVHWYPEARGDNRIVFDVALTEKDVEARLQAPRTLWDPTYVEDSWIGEFKQDFLPLIPALQASIDAYYPGTQLGITEYNYGAGNSISGGLAQVDVLGIFGELNVHLATLWQVQEENAYLASAYKLYRNYDGNLSTFGDTRVDLTLSDTEMSSVYAAVNSGDASTLHIIVINKHKSQSAGFEFQIEGDATYAESEVWFMDAASSSIKNAPLLEISGRTFSYTVPALTAMHFVLR